MNSLFIDISKDLNVLIHGMESFFKGKSQFKSLLSISLSIE